MLSANELLAHAETLTDGVQLVDRILRAGLFLHASDIHFDPMQDAVRVRFRIDGQLEEVLRVPVSMANAMTSRLKVLASLDIAERRAPQDGGFVWRLPGGGTFAQNPLDVRMATLPVRHGASQSIRRMTSAFRLSARQTSIRPTCSVRRATGVPHRWHVREVLIIYRPCMVLVRRARYATVFATGRRWPLPGAVKSCS